MGSRLPRWKQTTMSVAIATDRSRHTHALSDITLVDPCYRAGAGAARRRIISVARGAFHMITLKSMTAFATLFLLAASSGSTFAQTRWTAERQINQLTERVYRFGTSM